MKVLSIAIFIMVLLLLSSLTSSAEGQNSVNIFPPESEPYGLPYEEHVKNFWKWVLSIPSNLNPWNDDNGENCIGGQNGTNSSVFYLSGNGGGKSDRTCKVPAGKGLFIPVSPMELNYKEAPGATLEDLHKLAKKDQDSLTSINLQIGDKVYDRPELEKYRRHTSDFNVVFPNNPVFGVTEGPTTAVADGYYVITEPLRKGNYTILYTSSLLCVEADCPDPNFVQDLKYTLIVE
ncbi:MAG TPA: hypothetical protein VFC05_13410 [Nitrososphaeraceae archaeon]|nr:hypothetical protein [Nitrososphaeraceae archaeon]